MKKSLVLAMAMALGVTASAYAANPFSDVPAGHWAYDSINKLAAAGIVNGYEDGTFKGQKLMTRYEMAKIVATAMAKGANVDRLASEFADELDSLGVRVANLEKKSDNVKINGQFRYSYYHNTYSDKAAAREHDLRSRIWVNGQVNDDWKYVGMLQNTQNISNNVGDEGTSFQRAYLEGKLGGMQVTAGRQDFQLGDANLYDTRMDGIKVSYGDKVKFGAYYGKPTDQTGWNVGADTAKYGKFYGVSLGTEVGKLTASAAYDRFADGDVLDADDKPVAGNNVDNLNVWNVAATYNFGNASLGAIYLDSNAEYEGRDSKGYVVTGTVGGAEASKVGSVGLTAKYYNQGIGTFVAHTMNGDAANFMNEGFKGYSAGVNYTVAKNMVAGVEYYDLKSKEDSDKKAKTLWGELVVTF